MEDCEIAWSYMQGLPHTGGNTVVTYFLNRKSIIQLKIGQPMSVGKQQCINDTSFSLFQER